jgi:hypothetical protein
MTITAISHAAAAIETVTAYGARIYMMASEVFTISAILWCLNFLAGMVEKTYNAGRTVGAFYFAHLHDYVMASSKHIIAMVILLSMLTYEGAQYLYLNRREIVAKLNDLRNAIGQQFAYQSPAIAIA